MGISRTSLYVCEEGHHNCLQTILGPIWYLLRHMLTMFVYIIVFGNIAKIPTDGIPSTLFYMTGIIIWNYFNESVSQTSDTFFRIPICLRRCIFQDW